jgi:putative ABC transport system substrate-binding protein
MRRREFVAGVLGTAAWPLVTRAQQPLTPVIGFLHSATVQTFSQQFAAFRDGLNQGGFIEGENVTIEYRWAEGQSNRLPALAADLVQRRVNVMVAAGGNNSNLAAKSSTTTIPIVFVSGSDPIKLGLVPSLNHPGGNITGFSFFAANLAAKALGLLHEIVPSTTAIAALVNTSGPEAQPTMADLQQAASALGVTVQFMNVPKAEEIDQAFETMKQQGAGALFVSADPLFGSRIAQIVALAEQHRIPAIYYRKEFPVAGGLISYGTDQPNAYRQAGLYAARILKGEKPADLPVLLSTKFELVVNLKTAKALGLTVPPSFLARADEVIE